jgi:hypothetical protein
VAAAAAETLAEERVAAERVAAETLAVAMRADLAAASARPGRVRGRGRRGGNGGESVGCGCEGDWGLERPWRERWGQPGRWAPRGVVVGGGTAARGCWA